MQTNEDAHVVVAIDLDDTARVTLATALRLAGPQGRITVVHVAAEGGQVRRDAESASQAMIDDERRIRTLLTRELGDASNPMWGKIDAQIGVGDAALQIVQAAVDVEADFIVVGTHERAGLERLALGSVSSEVSRRAPCTVVIAREADYEGRDKTAEIDAPLPRGQNPRVSSSGPIGHRPRRFALHDANVIPTGIPPHQVR